MKFTQIKGIMKPELMDWVAGEEMYYLDTMPGGAFGIALVKTTNSKNEKDGKKNCYVDFEIEKTIYLSPHMDKMWASSVWPISMCKNLEWAVREAIYTMFQVEHTDF